MIFHYIFTVLTMDYSTFVNHNLTFVPFTERLLILRNSWNHVVQRSRLTVVVLTQLSIWVVSVVEQLIFRTRDVNRFIVSLAILFSCHFLSQVEAT